MQLQKDRKGRVKAARDVGSEDNARRHRVAQFRLAGRQSRFSRSSGIELLGFSEFELARTEMPSRHATVVPRRAFLEEPIDLVRSSWNSGGRERERGKTLSKSTPWFLSVCRRILSYQLPITSFSLHVITCDRDVPCERTSLTWSIRGWMSMFYFILILFFREKDWM